MSKDTTRDIMDLFAACLRILYRDAALIIPETFDPETEAKRLFDAIATRNSAISNSNLNYVNYDLALRTIGLMSEVARENAAESFYLNKILPLMETK